MNVFYANCKYENWNACKENEIFGLKGKRLPNLETGDLILLRVTGHTGEQYGVKAIWRLDDVEQVSADTFVPLTDSEYNWVLHCTSLVIFEIPFSEEFATSSKISQKIDSLFATRIMGSIGAFKTTEAIDYLECILDEKDEELKIQIVDNDESHNLSDYIQDVISALKSDIGIISRPSIKELTSETATSDISLPNFGIVGERIDLPILNYAPLNEMGVIVLFGYYLKDLGFSHLEEIRSGFPDAIGMQRIDNWRYRRVRIEFEFQSRNFVTHKHNVDECDVIVCWENNWQDCPLEVIELKSVLFPEME